MLPMRQVPQVIYISNKLCGAFSYTSYFLASHFDFRTTNSIIHLQSAYSLVNPSLHPLSNDFNLIHLCVCMFVFSNQKLFVFIHRENRQDVGNYAIFIQFYRQFLAIHTVSDEIEDYYYEMLIVQLYICIFRPLTFVTIIVLPNLDVNFILNSMWKRQQPNWKLFIEFLKISVTPFVWELFFSFLYLCLTMCQWRSGSKVKQKRKTREKNKVELRS